MSNPYDKPRFTLGELKPKNIEPGEGWRLLEEGEETLPNDEFRNRSGNWVPWSANPQLVGVPWCGSIYAPIRRRITPEPPEPETGIDHDLIRKTIQRLSMVEMARGYLRYMAVRRWNHRETGIPSEKFDERTDRRVMENARNDAQWQCQVCQRHHARDEPQYRSREGDGDPWVEPICGRCRTKMPQLP